MYCILKIGIFHCDVSLPEATFLLGYGLYSRAMLVSGRVHGCSDSSDITCFEAEAGETALKKNIREIEIPFFKPSFVVFHWISGVYPPENKHFRMENHRFLSGDTSPMGCSRCCCCCCCCCCCRCCRCCRRCCCCCCCCRCRCGGCCCCCCCCCFRLSY